MVIQFLLLIVGTGRLTTNSYYLNYTHRTGLNKLDSDTSYSSTRGYTTPGIRLLHVDSRLAKYSYASSKWNFAGYAEPTNLNANNNIEYDFAHSNTPSESENSNFFFTSYDSSHERKYL